jgi:hypothetical protein
VNKILLVGELNPYGADPDFALYPHPREASGNRLRLILGLTDTQYLGEHDRANLCEGKWSMPRAVERALEIHGEREGCGIVLCGVRVAGAFRRAAAYGPSQFAALTRLDDGGRFYLTLPHPSGRNLVWNDPEVKRVARHCYDVLRLSVGLAPVEREEGT